MQNVNLRKMTLTVLRKFNSYALWSSLNRRKVATSLEEMFNKALNECLCMNCGHLDEVHMINGCLGGPNTDCACKGFQNQ